MKKPILAVCSAVIICISCCLTYAYFNEKENDCYEREEEGEEGPETGADKALNAWWLSKAYPDPTNFTGKYMAAWKQAKEIKRNTELLFNTSNARMAGYGNWTAFGPKVFGGRILSLAINPTLNAASKRTIFAGSASGGIWKTYDDGTTATSWQPVATDYPVMGVSSIVYKPGDTSTLLAGTGEVYRIETYTNGANSSNQVGNIGRNVWKARGTYGIGILKSTDGGLSWDHVLVKDTQDLTGIQRIRFDPTNATIVYACSSDSLFKSTNSGTTWTAIWPTVGIPPSYVSDVVIDPSNNQNVVIAVGNVGNSNKGVWKSTNGGTSFTQITPGAFPTAAKSGYRGNTRLEIGGTNTIFASIGMNDLGSGYNRENEVYMSTNFGTTWTVVTNAAGGTSSTNHGSYQSWYSHVVMPYPGSTTKAFMAGVNSYVLSSISGGSGAVTQVGTGGSSGAYLTPGASEGTNYLHADVHDVQWVPGSSTTAYFATDGGIFRTTNANASPINTMTFSSCNGGLQVQQFYPNLAQSRTGTTIIGGLQDNNIVRYNGTGWAKIVGGDGASCMFKVNDENIVMAFNDTRGANRSINNGTSFPGSPLNYMGSITVPHDDRTAFVCPQAVTAANPNRWYVASDNIHVSDDAGATFLWGGSPDNGIPGTHYVEARWKPAIAIGVSNTDANKLYVSVSPFAQDITNDNLYYNPPANIRKSIDGGLNFTTVTNGLPDRFVTDFAVNSTDDNKVFVSLSGFGTSHVYYSTNGGTTWTPRGNGLPDIPFNTLMIDPVNSNIIYAGCDFGIYVSPDNGVNWYDYNVGLWDATYVMDLQLATVAGVTKIRAATHGKGIFEGSLFTLSMLPVNIISFTGDARGNTNELRWTVGSELNMSRYELERSTTGGNFKTIGSVNIHSNNPNYIFNDPLQDQISFYYRLKAINSDGSYKFSEVIQIKRQSKESFQVLGNPFQNAIRVKVNANDRGKLLLNLYDLKGRLVKKEEVVVTSGLLNYSVFGMENLPKGMYVLEALLNKQRWSQKVMKE